MKKYPKGIIKIKVNGKVYNAEYIGRQDGFECLICGKGCKCYTFNIFETKADYDFGSYETWGFGQAHLPLLIEEKPKRKECVK